MELHGSNDDRIRRMSHEILVILLTAIGIPLIPESVIDGKQQSTMYIKYVHISILY